MYTHAAVGGTFDHFHDGHKKLLHTAFEQAERVTIGIVKNPSSHKRLSAYIQPYILRYQAVETFLKQTKNTDRAELFELNDIYGSTAEDTTVDALVVTPETHENGMKINELRKEKKLPPIHCIEVTPVLDSDGIPLSSTRIRLGAVSREGQTYRKFFENNTFASGIPAELRDAVSRPMGELIKGNESDFSIAARKVASLVRKQKPAMIITIGDVVSETLYQAGVVPDVSIIDNRTRRVKVSHPKQYGADEIRGVVFNPSGSIQDGAAQTAIDAMQDSLKAGKHIEVIIDGEEDLMGIPVVMTAPLESVFVYGQHGLGIVMVRVTEAKKQYYLSLVRE